MCMKKKIIKPDARRRADDSERKQKALRLLALKENWREDNEER